MVEELEMAELFDSELRISPLASLGALETVLDEVQLLQDPQERHQVMSSIAQAFRPRTQDEQSIYGETKLNIGVKKLLNLTEMARLDPGQIGERLISSLIEQAVGGGGTIPERRMRHVSPPRSAHDEVSPGYYPGISI
jgi:vesicle-fusing ATPase